MKEIYHAIMRHLKNEVPELKWIDLDEGQLEYYQERPSVAFPCVLIDIEIRRDKDLIDTSQLCFGRISFRIAQNILTRRTNSQATELVRAEALKQYDLIDKMYGILQNYETDEFSALSRISQSKEKRADGLFVVNMQFDTTFLQK